MNAEKLTGAAIGLGSVVAAGLSASYGMPTGAMGAQYWESTRQMTATVAIFGMLAVIACGGVGIAVVHRHQEDKARHSRRVCKARRRHKRAFDSLESDASYQRPVREEPAYYYYYNAPQM